MDKLEYIPGDLVKIEYGEAAGKIGFVTNAILKRKGSYGLFAFIGKEFQGSSKDDWISTYNDEVSPIPLTTEILEKNGWKKPDGFDSYWLGKIGLLQFGEVWQYALGNTKIAITLGSIQYIHELQHLLFGLGLNSEMEV